MSKSDGYHVHQSPLDLDDIQGNILRGYRQENGRHFALKAKNGGGAREFLARIVDESGRFPQVTTAAHWGDERPPYCFNIGITCDGLRTMGVPESILTKFPHPFQEGPAKRAAILGDIRQSDPEGWTLGGPKTPAVHMMVSLYTTESRNPQRKSLSRQLRALFADFDLQEIWVKDTNAFKKGKIHFGYRDGISQPNVSGAPGGRFPDMQPDAKTGDFLLGKDYLNQYRGNYLGEIPAALGDNASFAAVRVLDQHVQAFEQFIKLVGKRYNIDPELVAAKLVGRWRNGDPLTLAPHEPSLDSERIPWDKINSYDYAPSERAPLYLDDREGLRCPLGSHMRRLNPRSGMVMGFPHSRRIIRRGMPYGPKFDPKNPTNEERGLFGYFICGDLGMQFEFILGTWANGDFSTAGLRGTKDPILGAQPEEGGQFVIRTDNLNDPIIVDNVPQMVTTQGSVYCLLPGIGGLRYVAGSR